MWMLHPHSTQAAFSGPIAFIYEMTSSVSRFQKHETTHSSELQRDESVPAATAAISADLPLPGTGGRLHPGVACGGQSSLVTGSLGTALCAGVHHARCVYVAEIAD